MKKAVLFRLFICIIVLMFVHKAISQTVSNSSFDGTSTGWTQDCASSAAGEVNNTQGCYDNDGTTSCTNYATCGSGCGTDPAPNYVAEVDDGNSPKLCQTVSGFTVGASKTLYLDLARRVDAAGSGGAADNMAVKVCMTNTGTGVAVCSTFVRTNTTWTGFTTSAFTFTASATSLVLSIVVDLTVSDYSGGSGTNGNYGMIVGYVGFSAPTPVTLLDFKAVKNDSEVDVNWQTATEINNDYFIVEKSKNGIDFIGIETIKGAGTSQQLLSYQTTDPSPYKGTSYYRLKQVDFDGKFSYSKIASVQNDEAEVDIYPNPNQGSFKISVSGEKLYDIEVADVEGSLVYKSSGNPDNAIAEITGLNKGVYIVRVIGEDTMVLRKLVVM